MNSFDERLALDMFSCAKPEAVKWEHFASRYSFYVGPNSQANGHPDKEDVNAAFYTFEITSRTHDLSSWAVVYHSLVLDSKKNEFVYEPFSSSRTKTFLKRCRFSTKEAAFTALQKYLAKWEPRGGGWIKKTT